MKESSLWALRHSRIYFFVSSLSVFLIIGTIGTVHNCVFSLCCYGNRCISSTSGVWWSWNVFSTRWYNLWGHQITAESLSRALWGISCNSYKSSWFFFRFIISSEWESVQDTNIGYAAAILQLASGYFAYFIGMGIILLILLEWSLGKILLGGFSSSGQKYILKIIFLKM